MGIDFGASLRLMKDVPSPAIVVELRGKHYQETGNMHLQLQAPDP